MVSDYYAVAPSETPGQPNTIRTPLRPIAVWQLDDSHFAFDSSVLLPSMTADLAQLVTLIRTNPRALLSIFGHTDVTGADEYNKMLGGRRALAVFALLTRNVQQWDHLFKIPYVGDKWRRENDFGLRLMREEVGDTAAALPAKSLFERYMDRLSRDPDDQPFGLPASAFLGKGKDAQHKAAVQGCGEFNPLLVFSAIETGEFARPEQRTARNEASAPNRRVTVLLFPPDTVVDASTWPCPRALEPSAGCRKRFWSDHAVRLSPGERRRTQPQDRDTFACRFYDRIALGSIAEPTHLVRLQLHDPFYEPCAGLDYQITGDGGFTDSGRTDSAGWLMCRLPRRLDCVSITYRPETVDIEYTVVANVVHPIDRSDQAYLAHLRNFGFGDGGSSEPQTILKFQGAMDLTPSAKLDDATKAAIDRL